MIPKECKRLAEVDFPIAEVSNHAAREKSIRYGHPSTFHLWWARRPLAACRAMLLALILPDPCDDNCPSDFLDQARKLLLALPGRPTKWSALIGSPGGLRRALFDFLAAFANWNNSANSDYISTASALCTAAGGGVNPYVVDPFSGGGSIPLEALRIGSEVFASDVNPVATLLLKALLEDYPRAPDGFVDEVRTEGRTIRQLVRERTEGLYPTEIHGGTTVAYIWARTVQCETPNCGAEIPIYKSPWLSKKGATKAKFFKEDPNGTCVALLVESAPRGGPIVYRLAIGQGSPDPAPGYTRLDGTKAAGNNSNVVCPCCGSVLSGKKANPRVQFQLSQQNGGCDVRFDSSGTRTGGARLLAVAVLKPHSRSRQFRLPTPDDYESIHRAQLRLAELIKTSTIDLPDEPLPFMSGTFNVPLYGMTRWQDVFTARQKVLLLEFLRVIRERSSSKRAVIEIVAVALSRLTDISNALCRWENTKTQVRNLFTRQAIPMVWDFAEPAPFSGQAGDFSVTLDTMLRVFDALPKPTSTAQVTLADARSSPLPDDSADVWFTDPPYYFAVPYADLSDFFFVWLKRALPGHRLLRDPFDAANNLTPKTQELCEMSHWDSVRYSHKDKQFFENGMADAFMEARRVLREDGIGCVVFAHKTTEGWEALLSGIIRGGWVITGSWPIVTESQTRLRARESAALATSVHLVCRPRSSSAAIGDWTRVLRELPGRISNWMERLLDEGVRGADLVFACIGPAMELYSRYARVEDAEGHEVPLGGDPEAAEPYQRGFLAYVWETVGRIALAQVLGTTESGKEAGDASLEEDARLTALFLWTLQSTNGATDPSTARSAEYDADDSEEDEDEDDGDGSSGKAKKGLSIIYDVVRRFSQPLGIHLGLWEGRIIETQKGIVRLLPVSERAKQLFGTESAPDVAERIERTSRSSGQLTLFPKLNENSQQSLEIKKRGRSGKKRKISSGMTPDSMVKQEATTLDRLHAAMLLQAGGQSNALRTLLAAEQDRGSEFLRLANALSALYPSGSEEKRLLDAMLLAVPR